MHARDEIRHWCIPSTCLKVLLQHSEAGGLPLVRTRAPNRLEEPHADK
jgi:hypothetical protein